MPTLRDLRRQRCLTQEPLAAAVEVSASTGYSAEADGFQRRSAIVRRLACFIHERRR
jgi:DNA-binding XRE family transcriptional regulator